MVLVSLDGFDTTGFKTMHHYGADTFDCFSKFDYRNGGGVSMKSSHHFRDQLSVMSGWFEQWNRCEQTVALFSLIQRVEPAHARFLALVLEQSTARAHPQLQRQEDEANDPGYISGLSTESKESAVSHLLSHLPLLRPGNREAKDRYLGLIPKILSHSIRHGVHIEESRQLLSYSLIHPAIPNEDRLTLTQWLRQLEDRIHNCPTEGKYPVSNGLEDRMHYPPPPLSNGLEDRIHNYPPPPINSEDRIHNYPPPTIGNEDRIHNYPPPPLSNGLEDRIHNYPPPPLSNGNGLDQERSYPMSNGLESKEGGGNFQFNAVPRLDLWRPGGLMGNDYGGLSNLGSNSLPPCIGTGHMALHGMNSAPVGGMSSHPDGTQTLPMPHSRVKRSCSLTPPGSEELSGFQLNGAHAPLSPQSSVTSSGSGSEKERDAFNMDGTGMKDVPCWLKGLRLHKYAYIFKNMTYEEMMSITEEKLEKMNITKGARHKIVLSIQKLCERQSSLRSLEKDIQDGEGTIRSALNEIKGVLQTPIKGGYQADHPNRNSGGDGESSSSDPPSNPPSPPSSDGGEGVVEGDLPGQITRLLGKICSSLLISPSLEEDLNFFGMITDKCLSHEAFSPAQKRRLFTWKQQIQKASHPLPPRRSLDGRQRNKWPSYHSGSVPLEGVSDGGGVCSGSSLRRRLPVQFQPPHRMALARQLSATHPRSQCTVIKRPSLQEHMKPHVQIQRTNSAPVRPHPLPASIFGKAQEGLDSNDPELNIRLESLCLSVTEHALGSFDGAVPLF